MREEDTEPYAHAQHGCAPAWEDAVLALKERRYKVHTCGLPHTDRHIVIEIILMTVIVWLYVDHSWTQARKQIKTI